jgi:hypothetical protein
MSPARRSFIVSKDELTLTDQRNAREMAYQNALQRATAKWQVGEDELVIRGFQCLLDAGTALEQWNTAALAVVGTAYSVFQAIAAPTLAITKLACFYKVGIESIAPFPVGLLTFRTGGAAGNIKYQFDLEQIINGETSEGYFSEVVEIDPNEIFAAQVLCRVATGVLARVQLGGFIVEGLGSTITGI